jgi:hypothetical protein
MLPTLPVGCAVAVLDFERENRPSQGAEHEMTLELRPRASRMAEEAKVFLSSRACRVYGLECDKGTDLPRQQHGHARALHSLRVMNRDAASRHHFLLRDFQDGRAHAHYDLLVFRDLLTDA